MTYKIFHNGGETIHFVEMRDGITVKSGQPFCDEFTTEEAAVARLIELRDTYFPNWDRDNSYEIGDRVKFGNCIFRALQQNDFRNFQLPNLELDPEAEIPTPMNRQARWKMVCNPEFEGLTNEEESY